MSACRTFVLMKLSGEPVRVIQVEGPLLAGDLLQMSAQAGQYQQILVEAQVVDRCSNHRAAMQSIREANGDE